MQIDNSLTHLCCRHSKSFSATAWAGGCRLPAVLLLAASVLACSSGIDETALAESGNDQENTQFIGGGTSSSTADNAIAGTPIELFDTAIGRVLAAGGNSRTLYTFTDDGIGVSNCAGSCSVMWPPLLASTSQQAGLDAVRAASALASVERGLGIITRQDFQLQWSFNGMPLYHYSGDGAAGETNGENLNGVAFVARPLPLEVATAAGFNGQLLRGAGSINSGFDDPALRTPVLDGHTLYTFALDIGGFSACNVGCSDDWPPLFADRGAVGADGFSVITRNSGAAQWAYNEQPLYFFMGDNAPGDVLGEGDGATRFVARP